MLARRFVRIVRNVQHWTGDGGNATESEDAWSLFADGGSDDFALTLLASYYGFRRGRGPMHDVTFVRLAERELLDTGAELHHTPHAWEFGWPKEVRESHYDLTPMDPSRERALIQSHRGGDWSDRLVRLNRVILHVHEVRLLRRADAPERFRETVLLRLRKLYDNEGAVFAEVAEGCRAEGVAPPTNRDFAP